MDQITLLIVSIVFFVFTILSLIKYIILSKLHPASLKVFSISIIAFTVFNVIFSIVELILFFNIQNATSIKWRVGFYAVMSLIHFMMLLTFYYICSWRMILKDDHLLYYDILGIKHKNMYSEFDTVNVDKKTGKIIIRGKNRRIYIPSFVENQTDIIGKIECSK